jgi:fumarate hydratase subunit alpha
VEAAIYVLKRSQTSLPPWVVDLLEEALQREQDPLAKRNLKAILENIAVARNEGLPLCQDTGLPVFHVELGRDADLDFSLQDALAEGVRTATEEVPLRPNAVDPISRENTGDNTGEGIPAVILDIVEGVDLRITALPKGAGSENMSFISMLNPADDPWDFVVRTVAERAANACPPLFVGIGIGGTFDLCASLAKRALLRMPGRTDLEMDLLRRINSLGIGPMGLGGDTTALGVKIEKACCHTASLPLAVNLQCWAHRSASALIRREGWSTD